MSFKRIASEIANLKRDTIETGLLRPPEVEDTLHCLAQISGPPGSAYEQKIFDIVIDLGEDYPRSPPQITFMTPLFHPNISSEGDIRLAEFDQSQWCPAITIRTILISLQAMLSDPNLLEDCILNEEAATLYLHDIDGFMKRAGQ